MPLDIAPGGSDLLSHRIRARAVHAQEPEGGPGGRRVQLRRLAEEEVYVVVGGSGRMKLDDEIVELKEWDVVRVPSGTWRGYESGPEGLKILVFGAPHLGENPRADVEGQRDWWAG